MRRADELRKRDRIILVCENGKTPALVQGIDDTLTERDFLPFDKQKGAPPIPVIGLHLKLDRPVYVPCCPPRHMTLMTLWVSPFDRFELYA